MPRRLPLPASRATALLLAGGVLGVAPLAPAAAQAGGPGREAAGRDAGDVPWRVAPGGFVTVRGDDTLAVERVTRDATGAVTSEVRLGAASGAPAGLRVRTLLVAGPDARVARAVVEVFPPDALRPAQRVETRYDAPRADGGDGTDGATVTVGTGVSRRVALAPGTLPWVNLSAAVVEQLVRRARALGGDATIPLFQGIGAPAMAAVVAAAPATAGPDSATLDLGGVTLRAAVDADGRVLGFAVPAQVLAVRRVDEATAAALLARPPAAPAPVDYAAPPGAPYLAESVRVPTPAGHVLAGTLTRPVGAGVAARLPVVVTITGSGPQERDGALAILPGYRPFRQLADTLARRGVAVLRLDDRGTGASTGDFAAATSADFADDVRAALAWLRARPDVDPARLALLGHSEGGLVAPMVAADGGAGGAGGGVAALVLLAAQGYSGRRVVDYQLARDVRRDDALPPARRDSLLARAAATRDSLLASTPWMRFFAAHDPLPTARRVRVPVLVVHGATDRQVTPEQADTLAAALRAGGNRAVTVRVFPATNHLLLADPSGWPAGYATLAEPRLRPEVLGVVADWVAARLAAAPAARRASPRLRVRKAAR